MVKVSIQTAINGLEEKLYVDISRDEVCDAIQDHLTNIGAPFVFESEGDPAVPFDPGAAVESALIICTAKPGNDCSIRITDVADFPLTMAWPDQELLDAIPVDLSAN